MTTNKSVRDVIHERQRILETAAVKLKQDFFGIDSIIDQIIEAVSSWFLFPNIHQRPVIVNLWGLTGVGKSALVKQLSSLIGYDRKFFRFDLGEKSTSEYVIKRNLREIYDRENGFPVILCFDEFQHARTIDEKGSENEPLVSRIVWEILDSGKFQTLNSTIWISEVYELLLRLSGLVRSGVQVKNGKVISGREHYEKEFVRSEEKNDNVNIRLMDVPFIKESFIEPIFWTGRELFEFPQDVRNAFDGMDGPETLHLLKKVMEVGESPKTVDCSKALVFVVGNLDEAYDIGGNMNPDLDADALHQESLRIALADVKRALKKRFRFEQIARLGNTHIVYPTLDRLTFRRIIDRELRQIGERLHRELGLSIAFDESVIDLIYQEGVFPTQGARPLFTTINQLITSKMGLMIGRISQRTSLDASFMISVVEDKLRISVSGFDQILGEETVKCILTSLRETKQDDLQAIVAVHESGHAVLMMALRGLVPTYVFSRTADPSVRGFVHLPEDDDYLNRKQMLDRAAERLAGFAAEELIFGEEHVTSGSQSDLHTATFFLTHHVRMCGLGDSKGQVMPNQLETAGFLHDKSGRVDEQIEVFLQESLQTAREVLVREKGLLLQLSFELTKRNKLVQEQIRTLALEYGSALLKLKLNGKRDQMSYRDILLNLRSEEGVAKMNEPDVRRTLTPISMNSGRE